MSRQPRGEEAWSELLDAFTRRNVSRRTVLEVDDLEIGAQALGFNYPLIAAMYDARDHRLQIVLGDQTAPHVRRSLRSGPPIAPGNSRPSRLRHYRSHRAVCEVSSEPGSTTRACHEDGRGTHGKDAIVGSNYPI